MSSIHADTTTGPDNTAMLTRAVVVLTFFVLAGPAAGHPALYHYLEINLLEPGEVSVYVTFHAPELSTGVAPLEEDIFGREWLATRDDVSLAALVENADRFAGEVFSFRFGDRNVVPDFAFPGFETIRRPPAGSVVPDGCFSGAATLVYERAETDLMIEFSATAEKRLMLIINRPAAFPRVIDLEPGGHFSLALPEAPALSRPDPDRKAILFSGAITLLLLLTLALMRRRRACLR